MFWHVSVHLSVHRGKGSTYPGQVQGTYPPSQVPMRGEGGTLRYLPSDQGTYPPTVAKDLLRGGGMPLAFTQDNFLVWPGLSKKCMKMKKFSGSFLGSANRYLPLASPELNFINFYCECGFQYF